MNHFKSNLHIRLSQSVIAAASLVVALTACGSKADEGAQATQVAAKVGDSEISVHQINQVLSRTNTGGATKEAVQAASQRVLEQLIDQQLAVDQATAAKLHRNPDVVNQLEAARREVLARAYIQQVLGNLPKLTPEDVKAYYDANPALFAERRVFNLQEIQVPDAAPVLAELRSMAASGKPIEEVANMLRTRDVKFGGGSATRPAEQLPLDLLPKVHALKDGQSLVITSGAGATFVRVASSRPNTVTPEAAAPSIAQFLNNRRSSEAVADEIKRLRTATTVTYMGEFQNTKAAAGTTAPNAATAAPAATAAVPSVTEPAPTADSDGKAAIERGLSGLK